MGSAELAPRPPGLSSVLDRNVQVLKDRHQREEREAAFQERLAEAVTRFTGSMTFVWIVLAMWASVEAIFLSTFVLISQNRMAAATDKRADRDLQISLLAEHEITKLTTLVAGIAERLDVRTEVEPEFAEIQQDVAPEAVLDALEESADERKLN
jgi:uncharacterized membrane protein